MISRQAEEQGTSAFYGAAVNSFFMIFVQHQDAPGPPMAYRGGDGNVVVYRFLAPRLRPSPLVSRHQEPEHFLYCYRVPAV